jgi:polyisoprenoid-binding protein YceI
MPMLKYSTIAILAVFFFGNVQAAETLELNTDESKIEFVGKKAEGQHVGGFKTFTSVAVADLELPANGYLEITIDATSLWSDDEKLTSHLKNPDFFDVRKHPKITFKSTGLQGTEEQGKATITGDLTMLGKTVSIDVPCTVVISEKTITVDSNFVIDRTKWGMTYGEGKVNNDVDVKAHLVFNR